MDTVGDGKWLLLIHQIPPKPNYFRVKIWRRLQRLGSVAIKNSVYVLPKSDSTYEDFQWVLREIMEGGGEASICEARFIDGISDAQVEALFHAAREADYNQLAEEARAL
ncbi:ChrB protein, partial [bacterium]